MILLTGITGNIGGATARALLDKGVRFRALVRDPGKAAAWAEKGVELVQGDIEDAAAVKRALSGIDRALLVMPNGEHQEPAELAFTRTAKEAGLAWLIKLSSPEAVRGTTSPIPLAHIAAEDAIMASGMKWTLVRPSFYMQNFRGSVKAARATGKLSMPMGNGTVALTDNNDAGLFLAHILTDPNSAQHYSQCYDITGPDPVMTFHDVAKVIGEVIGQPALKDEPAYKTHVARGKNQKALDDLIGLWTAPRTIDEIEQTMIDHGVPVGKVYRAADMLTDPHYAARASLVEVPSDKWPGIRQQNVFPKLSATPGQIRWAGSVELGSHTEEVLTELLGLTPEQVEKLRASGIV